MSLTPVAPGGAVVLTRTVGGRPAVLDPQRLPLALYQRTSRGKRGLGPRRRVDQDRLAAPGTAGDMHKLGRIYAPPNGRLRQHAIKQGGEDRVGDDPAGGDAPPVGRVRKVAPAPGRPEGGSTARGRTA